MKRLILILGILLIFTLVGCGDLMSYEGLSPFHVGPYLYPEDDGATKQQMKQIGHADNPPRSEGYCGICHQITDRW